MLDFMGVFATENEKKREKLMAALTENGSIAFYNDLMSQCSAPDAYDYPKLCAMVSHDYLCSYGGRGGILILPLARVTDCYITNLLPKYDFENIGLAVEAGSRRYSLAIVLANNKKLLDLLKQFCGLINNNRSFAQ